MPVQLTRRIREFTDISLSFQANPRTGDITVLKNERAIANALKNCVMFPTDTIAFDPAFGSQVGEMLFELDDDFTRISIQDEIERTIAYNEPRVEIIKVDVQDGGINEVKVRIDYKIIGYLEIFNVEFILTPTSTP